MMGIVWLAALTRAREVAILVGPRSAIEAALRGVQGDERICSLRDRLAAAAAARGLARSALPAAPCLLFLCQDTRCLHMVP
jgi:hypothetical protein